MQSTRSLFTIASIFTVAIETAAHQPSDALSDRYQRPDESTETARDRELDILETVLRFYRPSGSQSRWLDRERLPASPDSPEPTGRGGGAPRHEPEAAAAVLDAATADELIRRLGRGRFCASDARSVCRSDYGGRLRTSSVYRTDDDHARVVVDFESVWPHGPSTVSTQVFVLKREGQKWRIERRGVPERVDS